MLKRKKQALFKHKKNHYLQKYLEKLQKTIQIYRVENTELTKEYI